jgi:lysozyme
MSREASAIERCVPSLKSAPPTRYVAALDFAHNLGAGAFCRHGTAENPSIADYINGGDIADACDKLMQYRYAAGHVMIGIVRRREEERKLCLEESN